MAVDAVNCEPVSDSKFPVTGKNTGNSRVFGPQYFATLLRNARPERISSHSFAFPGKSEQGI
jgi:hypothetical protein